MEKQIVNGTIVKFTVHYTNTIPSVQYTVEYLDQSGTGPIKVEGCRDFLSVEGADGQSWVPIAIIRGTFNAVVKNGCMYKMKFNADQRTFEQIHDLKFEISPSTPVFGLPVQIKITAYKDNIPEEGIPIAHSIDSAWGSVYGNFSPISGTERTDVTDANGQISYEYYLSPFLAPNSLQITAEIKSSSDSLDTKSHHELISPIPVFWYLITIIAIILISKIFLRLVFRKKENANSTPLPTTHPSTPPLPTKTT